MALRLQATLSIRERQQLYRLIVYFAVIVFAGMQTVGVLGNLLRSDLVTGITVVPHVCHPVVKVL